MGETCLRCDGVDLVPLPDSPDTVVFFRCPRCHRDYTRAEGKELTDRWLSPISLALYGVIFEAHPSHAAEQLAQEFLTQQTGELLARIVEDIRSELAQPKQRVADVLPGMQADEAELREYLCRFANFVEASIREL